MRVLLDECVPRRLRDEISEHEVASVVEKGWGGIKNGELLRLAAAEFDAFLTVDQNVRHQQNLSELAIAVVVLVVVRNDINALRPLMPRVRELLPGLAAVTCTKFNNNPQETLEFLGLTGNPSASARRYPCPLGDLPGAVLPPRRLADIVDAPLL